MTPDERDCVYIGQIRLWIGLPFECGRVVDGFGRTFVLAIGDGDMVLAFEAGEWEALPLVEPKAGAKTP